MSSVTPALVILRRGEWCDKVTPVLGETYFFELNIGDLDKEEIMAFFR